MRGRERRREGGREGEREGGRERRREGGRERGKEGESIHVHVNPHSNHKL